MKPSIITTATAASLLVLTGSLASARTHPAEPANSPRELLREIVIHADAAESSAGTLITLVQDARYAPQSHLNQLNSIKDNLNAIGKSLIALDARRDQLEPWEAQALDRVIPLATEDAAAANNAISYYNANQTHLWGPEDEGYATKMMHDSAKIASTLRNYLKYEKLQEQESTVKAKLSE